MVKLLIVKKQYKVIRFLTRLRDIEMNKTATYGFIMSSLIGLGASAADSSNPVVNPSEEAITAVRSDEEIIAEAQRILNPEPIALLDHKRRRVTAEPTPPNTFPLLHLIQEAHNAQNWALQTQLAIMQAEAHEARARRQAGIPTRRRLFQPQQ